MTVEGYLVVPLEAIPMMSTSDSPTVLVADELEIRPDTEDRRIRERGLKKSANAVAEL